MNLDGKYHLITELGQGGMAVVHLAVVQGSMGFRKLAVVKLLRSTYARDPDFVEMFLQEARLCARLSHPNIVHTYEVGVDAGKHYLAMEFLDGVSLYAATALARKGGPFTLPMQARVLLDVLDGLKYAHELRDFDGKELKIVHRDVSPHNVFITFDGQVKVLDFGIAKAATSSVETATGVIKGKLTYMAPEQARGDLIDGRADLHAVGVMLWEAIAGRRRWPADMPQPALFTRLAADEMPPHPGGEAKGFPADFDRIALRGCDPREAERYQTAAEFHAELEQALRKVEPVSLREVGAMLREAFAEDRKRLHSVIEEQVQEIVGSSEPTGGSDVSTMRPPRRRGEQSDPSIGAASLGAASTSSAMALGSDPHAQLHDEASATDTASMRRAGPRSAFSVSIIVAAMLAGLMFAMYQSGGNRAASALTFREGTALGASPGSERLPNAPAAAPRPGAVSARSTKAQEDAQQELLDTTPAAPQQAAPRQLTERNARPSERRHSAAAARSSATAEPAAVEEIGPATGLAAPVTRDVAKPTQNELPTLRHPTVKPKVQLDEENPWN